MPEETHHHVRAHRVRSQDPRRQTLYQGTRISVEFLLELVAQGASRADILKAYPHLATEDVEQALRYAARFLENEVVITAEIPH